MKLQRETGRIFLNSLRPFASISSCMIDLTTHKWYLSTWHKWISSNQLILTYMKNSWVEISTSTRMTYLCVVGPDHATEHVNKTMMRWPQGLDPEPGHYGKMGSYCSRIQSPCHRSRGPSWITNAQLHSSPWFIRSCCYLLWGECEEAERGILMQMIHLLMRKMN